MKIPDVLKYTKDHEWIKIVDSEAIIGITDFAQKELGDIVFIEIETEGENLTKGETFGTIEAVKTVSDMFMPISGKVVKINPKLSETPEIVNKDPYGDGWMIKISEINTDELNELLSAEAYAKLVNA
jgi:glycine cleavage system H protein